MRSVLFAALAALAPFVATSAQISYHSAALEGAQEVPSVATSATGWGVVRLDQAICEVKISVHTDGVPSTAAHLHFAAAGFNGPVVVPLSGGPSDWTGSAIITMTQAADLIAGDSYLNVHSAAHPDGEIRGQVLAEVTRRFTAFMDGATATPPAASNATGQVIAYLHEPANRLIYEVDVTGMAGTVAHIHLGLPGVAGPPIIPLNGGGTRWCGVTPRMNATQLADLLAGNYYVNAHSGMFPSGEVRGQLLLDPGNLVGELDGSQEVPPIVTNATGHACLTLNPDRSLSYHVTTRNLVNGTASHLHLGAFGVNGGVIFPLSGGPTEWQGTLAPLNSSEVAILLSGGYYVNVHSTMNPGGEIRGNPELTVLPTTFGSGCVDSNGDRAEIGSDGAACLGDPFVVTLQGTQANSPATLLFGRSREVFNMVVPLPFELGIIGMPTCFLFHDARLTNQTRNAVADTLGCASASLNIPADATLLGFELFAQWFVVDPGAIAGLPLVVSNALQATIK